MTLQLHNLKSAVGSRHRRKIVGRGNASGHGTYSGRGGKGQTARSGGTRGLRRKALKALVQSVPKLRGFKSLETRPAEVRLADLEKKFATGEKVNLSSLKTKRLIGINAAQAKVIGQAELTKKLEIEGLKLSAGAKALVEKAGGSIK